MDRTKRAKYILHRLATVRTPVKGSVLAEECQVTRQVIVRDISKLRVLGKKIVSTPRGYQLIIPEKTGFKQILQCRHGMDQLREELYTITDLGGVVLNVSVEHESYGYLKMEMKVNNHEDADHYVAYLRDSKTTFMSNLRDGIHRYLIETKSKETMAKIRQALEALDLKYKQS